MARAQFQKGQRVWVDCVGAWAVIEQVQPIWAKGFDEPLRVTYDVGLGREFLAGELTAPAEDPSALTGGDWRLMRARNKWQPIDECQHHPVPGTYPVVVTDRADWGGWRVPGAEYDRDPAHIEFQARLIAASPRLMRLAERLIALSEEAGAEASPGLRDAARDARAVLREVVDSLIAPPESGAPETHYSADAA